MALTLPISTPRLSLRGHTTEDAAWLLSVYSQPDFCRYLLGEPWEEGTAQEEVVRRCSMTDLDGPEQRLRLVVEHEGTPVGDVSLKWENPEQRVAEIGWAIDPKHSGRGYAAEAAKSVIGLAFEHYDAHRVVAYMDARNEASARLAERIGMTREAHHRQDWWSKGEWTDTFVYAMLSSDPR